MLTSRIGKWFVRNNTPDPNDGATSQEDMFKRATGLRYTRFLDTLHRDCLFDWYMEIGCRTGKSFAPVQGRTVAIDPFFRIETNVIGAKPALHLFQQSSDDFFASGFLEAMQIRLSFSFLDGMHLFDYLLRDFIATERASSPDGVIALHDCCPFTHTMTTRDLDNLPKGAWTGDVWKLIPILRDHRPDLEITVLDAAPTGLVLVSNLDPSSRCLKDLYPDLIREYEALALEDFGVEAFCDLFEYTGTQGFIDADYPLFAKIRRDPASSPQPQRITP